MIAQTIAHQIGIPAFALLGAHTLVDLEDGLQFRIRGCDKINIIQIILDPSDTYTVKFGKLEYKKKTNLGITYTEATWQIVSTHGDIYCDMLHDLIEQETSLYTRFKD